MIELAILIVVGLVCWPITLLVGIPYLLFTRWGPLVVIVPAVLFVALMVLAVVCAVLWASGEAIASAARHRLPAMPAQLIGALLVARAIVGTGWFCAFGCFSLMILA